ncbi:NADH-quinone oxidoreductase subunit L [candidate division KSB1 bacterium]
MLLTTAIIIWLLPLLAFTIQIFFGKKLPRQGDWVVVGAMFICLILALGIFANVMMEYDPDFRIVKQFDWIELGEQNIPMGFLLDNVTAVMLVVVTLVSFLVFLFSIEYMHGDPRYSRFFAYLSLFAFSMLGLILFESMLGMFMCWELVGLCSYLLIGFWFEKDSAAEAGKKAFITNRVGDFGMLLGLLMTFATIGSVSLGDMQHAVEIGQFHGITLTLAGIFFFMGAMGKSAQFPLHIWLPDAMEGPTPVSALIHAATMVAAGVYMLVRIFFLLTPDSMLVIAYIGGFTALFSATVAIAQNDIKRVLAYSTVSQLGYMVLAIGTGSYTAALFHLMTHAFFKAQLFLGSGSVIHAMHHALHEIHDHDSDPQDMRNMGGLRKKMPITFWSFIISTVAISGVPFTSGFLSKDAILAGSLSFAAQNPQHFLLPFFGFAAAGLTAFYMFRLVFKTFFGEFQVPKAWDFVHENKWTITAPLAILATLSFFLFYSPNPTSPSEGWFYHQVQKPYQAAVEGVRAEDSHDIATESYEEQSGEHAESADEHGGHDPTHTYALMMSLLIAFGGIIVSTKTYYFKSVSAEKWGDMYPKIYRGMLNKWYIDEFIDATFIKFTFFIAWLCRLFDTYVVDGIVNGVGKITIVIGWFIGLFDLRIIDGLVNGIANVTQVFGWFARQLQTGRIQNYLVGALLAMILIIIFRVI